MAWLMIREEFNWKIMAGLQYLGSKEIVVVFAEGERARWIGTKKGQKQARKEQPAYLHRCTRFLFPSRTRGREPESGLKTV
jgi:hypothetical protein